MKKAILILVTIIIALKAMAQNTNVQLREDNIDEVINVMTIEEKIRILVGTGMKGVSIGMPVIGSTRMMVPGSAGTSYPIERLGIPAIVFADGPAGLRIDPKRDFDSKSYYCTHFPIGTCLSSTWNINLVEQVATAMGNEAKEYGVDVLLGPGNNIHRNPLCGRNFEYYSEDPLLSGNIASAYIRGVQSQGVGASLKHFAFNNQETHRMGTDARVSQRAAREIYLKPFEIAVKQAQPWTVMTSYNKVNGRLTSERRDLLTDILRQEWGFQGMVVTDWFGGTNRELQVMAGNDMIQPGLPNDPDKIKRAVADGKITLEQLDKNVRRILQLIVKTPHFKNYHYSNKPDLEGHVLMARDAAAEGIVLLKNKGVLPMDNINKVAVFGNTSYDIIAGGTGSGNVNSVYTVSLIEGLRNNGYIVDKAILETYRNYLEDFSKKHTNDENQWWNGKARAEEMPLRADSIAACVARNDVAIVTIGRISGEGGDRKKEDFYLSETEQQMINDISSAFHKAGKQVVVILNIGGTVETTSWKHLPDAILLPWQGGQECGNSIADVLSGKKNPSGRLPMTFPIAVEDHYSSKNMVMDAPIDKASGGLFSDDQQILRKNIDYTNYEEDIYVGYRYFDTFRKEVSYPFGYGLSYTTFDYSDMTCKAVPDGYEVSVKVTNTSLTEGKEVIQVYASAPKIKAGRASHELVAFAKTRNLKPDESEVLTMKIALRDLAWFNANKSAWALTKGKYILSCCSDSRTPKLSHTISIGQNKTIEHVHDVLKPEVKLNLLKAK